MKQRICLLGPGNNVHFQRWAAALRERGLHISLISTTPLPASMSRFPSIMLPAVSADLSRRGRLITLLRSWARVPGLVAALNPDLVHLHSLPVPAAVPFLRGIPRLIVSPWGSDVVQRDRRKARFYPVLLDHAVAITTTSHYLAEVTSTYLHAPRTVDVVPFGVDLQQFAPPPAPSATTRIGTARHLEANYGLDTLLDALPLVRTSVPLDSCIIAGDGSLREQLQAHAAALGITSYVRWSGRVPHRDMPQLLRSFTVFVNPSRAESFGVAALEAQACGVPVVASNVGGLPEVVRDDVTGLLVPPNDPPALAAAIVKVLSDSEQRAAMSQAARAWVGERYHWQANVSQMINVYESLVDGTTYSVR